MNTITISAAKLPSPHLIDASVIFDFTKIYTYEEIEQLVASINGYISPPYGVRLMVIYTPDFTIKFKSICEDYLSANYMLDNIAYRPAKIRVSYNIEKNEIVFNNYGITGNWDVGAIVNCHRIEYQGLINMLDKIALLT